MKLLLKVLSFVLCVVLIFSRTVFGASQSTNCVNVELNWIQNTTRMITKNASNNGSKWFEGENCIGTAYDKVSEVLDFGLANSWGWPAFIIDNQTEAKNLFYNKQTTDSYTTTKTISSSTNLYPCSYSLKDGPSCDIPLGQALTLYMPVYVSNTINSKLLTGIDPYRNTNNTITVYAQTMCSQYATINFYGILSSGNYGKIGSAKYDYATNKWKKSTDTSVTVTKIDDLGLPLNYSSSIKYNNTTYSTGISAYAALYSAVNLTANTTIPSAPTNIISTKTTAVIPYTENPNIQVGQTLPNLQSVLFKDNDYADEVKYIVLYAANCLDPDGASLGATCNLKIANGRAIYTNTCLNGTSLPNGSYFGTTEVPKPTSVTVSVNFSGNKTCMM